MSANRITFVAATLAVAGTLAAAYATGIAMRRQSQEQSTRIIEQENARFCTKIGVAPESAAFSTCVEGLGDLRRSHEQRIQAEMQGLL